MAARLRMHFGTSDPFCRPRAKAQTLHRCSIISLMSDLMSNCGHD